jgi:hypothetical protein
MKIRLVRTEFSHADGRTDRETDMARLIVAFHNVAYAPKKAYAAVAITCLLFWILYNFGLIGISFGHSSPVRLTSTCAGTTTSISFHLLSPVLASLLPCELLGWNVFGASKCCILKFDSVLEFQSMQLLLRESYGMYETLTWQLREIYYNVKVELGLYLIKHHPMKSGGTDPHILNLGARPR